MNQFQVKGPVQRFEGDYGWFYVALQDDLSSDLREMIRGLWPALLKAEFTLGGTVWRSSIMPIKNGPLFIALPARVRTTESISIQDVVTIRCKLLAPKN